MVHVLTIEKPVNVLHALYYLHVNSDSHNIQ